MSDDAEERVRSKTVITVISRIAERPVGKEACLVVIYGMELGKKFNLEGQTIILGRSAKSDIQIDQESVSRNHAKIMNTGQSIILRDLGSTNGTYVNDELIDEYVLRDGDFIKIGRTIFKFLTGSNIENAYHEEIYRLTTVDGLTQVFNKRYFMEALEREMSRAARYRRELSLIMFDIDHFKKINDSFGHPIGDEVLREFAVRLASNVRAIDLPCRYGGEEFTVIMPDTKLEDAQRIAERIRLHVAGSPFRVAHGEEQLTVTISIGVASTSGPGDSPEALLKRADEAVYEAKAAGRNKVVARAA